MLDPRKTTLPRAWATDFALALRTRDVTGTAIGAALREAESHCAESGQSPQEAFGDPAAYAESLTHLPRTVESFGGKVAALAPTLLGMTGLFVALATVDAWQAGRAVGVPLGSVLALAVLTTFTLTVLGRPALLRSRWWFTLAASLTVLVATAALALATTPLLTLPVGVGAAYAVATLAASTWWSLRSRRTDPIDDPLDPVAGQGRTAELLLALTLPLGTVVAVAIALLLPGR